MDTNGVRIHNIQDAISSNGNIVYGTVYLNPNPNVFSSVYRIKTTISHEIGHILRLGHPNGIYYNMDVPSVMNQEQGVYAVPQEHDINDIVVKYG